LNDFVEELRRRHVIRVATAYAVTSWLILQAIDVVFPILGLDDALGRPILVLLLAGFPIALVTAWYFEITPEGIKLDREVRGTPLRRPTGRTLDRIIIVVLVFAVALLLVDKLVLQEADESTRQRQLTSIAVLPFVNRSESADNEYFSDGLTETLMHMLSQLPELRVAARTSVFSFKGQDADVREIARQLDVATVLQGSVQRAGNTVRINAQLTEADTGFNLWSASFDRSMTDIFAVQDEIARSVAAALKQTLLGDAAGGAALPGLATRDAAAYEKYLLGLEQKNVASYASLPLAEGLFKEALALDPDFVEATIELASTYMMQAETGILTPEETQAGVLALLEPVLDADPQNGRALGILATLEWQAAVQVFGPGGKPTQLTEMALRHANALAPNDTDIYFSLAFAATAASRSGEALAWVERGLEVDPLSARLHQARGRILLGQLDDPDEAVEAFQHARSAAPEWTAPILALGDANITRGRYADGIEWYLRAMELDPRDNELPAMTARRYFELGLDDEGVAMLDRARALAPGAEWTRSIELGRQLRAGNHERAASLAEQMLRDDVSNRGSAFIYAATGYASSMLELGKPQSVVDMFESLRPGISTPGNRVRGLKELVLKFILVHMLNALNDFDTAGKLLEDVKAKANEATPGWQDEGYALTNAAIAQGDLETAIGHALADLRRPLGMQTNWQLRYRGVAWLEPVVADERVAARLAALDNETAQARSAVRAMLAQRIGR